MFADLHLHTHFSDGTWSPEEVAARGRQQQLSALSVTDHDTVEACTRMAAACRHEGLEFIAGTELTAEMDDLELHLLGYHVQVDHPRLLLEMARFQSVRLNRIREMVERLNRLQIPLQIEAVLRLANCRSPGRPHIGRALVEGGFCRSMDEAFERFLKRNRPAWVPKFKISAPDAIALIHEAGGLASLAHPGISRVDELIPQLAEARLDAIECYHTKHNPATTEYYLDVARRFGLLVTGGSDCHGMNKGQPLIGTVRLPYEHVQRLNAARDARHATRAAEDRAGRSPA